MTQIKCRDNCIIINITYFTVFLVAREKLIVEEKTSATFVNYFFFLIKEKIQTKNKNI